MVTVRRTVEMYPWRAPVTRASPGLPSVLIGTTEHQTTSLNWAMPAMHAGTLVDRPLTALGVTLRMLQCDGSIVISLFVLQVRIKFIAWSHSLVQIPLLPCGHLFFSLDITEDATLSDWSPFTNCSVSCGSGSKTRYRTCYRSRFGGKNCSSLRGALTEQRPCNVHNCSGKPLIYICKQLQEAYI